MIGDVEGASGGGEETKLTIWQQNVDKSLMAQQAVLNTVDRSTDILCIQEPYFDFNKKLRAI